MTALILIKLFACVESQVKMYNCSASHAMLWRFEGVAIAPSCSTACIVNNQN